MKLLNALINVWTFQLIRTNCLIIRAMYYIARYPLIIYAAKHLNKFNTFIDRILLVHLKDL